MITKKDIMEISSLSKLYLSENEINTAINDISSMVKFVSQVNSVDASFEPLESINEVTNSFRDDKIVNSFPREEVLENAQGGKEGFFCVEKAR